MNVNTLKQPTAVRLQPDTKQLLRLLMKDTGLSQTGVIELSIRDQAKKRGIVLPDTEEQERA